MANNITSTVSASLTTTSQRSMIDFNVCHSNAQSLSAHLHDLQRVIQKNTIHVLGISETHLQPTMSSKLVSVPDFKLFRVDRSGGRQWGGVAIYVHHSIPAREVFRSAHRDTHVLRPEFLAVELTLERAKVLCLTVYSPPKSGLWSDVEEALFNCNGSFDHIILMGDLNINWEVTSTPLNIPKDFLSYSSLVRVPFADTYHRLDGSHSTLDYICVSDVVKVSSYKQECIPSISMHDVIIVSRALSVPRREPMSVTRRCYRSFQLNHLLDDLSRVDWSAVTSLPDIDSKVSVLTNSLVSAYNKHAPVREFIIKKNGTP